MLFEDNSSESSMMRWIILCMTLLCLSSSGLARIGILGALPREVRLFQEEMKVEKVVDEGGRTFMMGKLWGKDVVLGISLYGKVNAGVAAQLMMTLFDVKKLIFTGVAGALDPDLRPGDVLISTDVVQHDFGRWIPEKFELWEVVVSEKEKVTFFRADSVLVLLALRAGKKTDLKPVEGETESHEPRVIAGRLVTGDQFIAWEEKRRELWEGFQALAVDMEGGAVAQVCFQNSVPFVIIRCISDLADESAEFDYEQFVEIAADNSAKLVKRIIIDLD